MSHLRCWGMLGGGNAGLRDKLSQHRLISEGFGQWLIQCRQRALMLTRERDKVAISNLICTTHQIRTHDAISATQVIRNEAMTRIGEQLAQYSKCRFRRHTEAEQRVRRYTRKAKL